MQLRPYQIEAIQSLDAGWLDPAVLHQLLCLGTGCGKTIAFSFLAKRAADRGGRATRRATNFNGPRA